MAAKNTRGILQRAYFSSTEESTYDTAETLTHFANLQSDVPVPSAEFYSSIEEGSGTEEENALELIAKDARFTLNGRLHDTLLPLLLSFALGGDTHAVVPAKTGSYQHLIEPASADTELCAFTCEVHSAGAADATAGSSAKFTGCVIDTLRISAARKGWWNFSADIIGSGTVVTGSAQTESSLSGATVYYPVSMSNFWRSSAIEASFSVTLPTTALTRATDLHATGQVDLATLIRDFEWTIANNLQADDGYTPDSDDVRGQLLRGNRVQTISYTLDFNATTAAYIAELHAGTVKAFEACCVTATECYAADSIYHGFKFIFPQYRMTEPTRGGGMGPQTLGITGTVEDDGTNSTVDVYVWNGEDVDYGS